MVSTETLASWAMDAMVVAPYPCSRNRRSATSSTALRVASACCRRRGESYRRTALTGSAIESIVLYRLRLTVTNYPDGGKHAEHGRGIGSRASGGPALPGDKRPRHRSAGCVFRRRLRERDAGPPGAGVPGERAGPPELGTDL